MTRLDVTPASAAADSGSLRERIIEEATRLFADQGFSATSIRQLAAACGCTKPSLYYYFDNKETLFREVAQLHLDAYTRLVHQLVAGDGPLRERIHAAVGALIDHAEHNPAAMQLLQRIESRPEDGAPRVDVMGARRLHLDMLASLIEWGIDAGEIRPNVAPFECALVLSATVSLQCEMALATSAWDRPLLHRTIDLVFDGIAV